MTRTSSPSGACSIVVLMRSTICGVSAFFRRARFNVTVSTPSSRETTTSSSEAACSIASPRLVGDELYSILKRLDPIAPELVRWVEHVTDGRLVAARRHLRGGSRATWMIEVQRDAHPRALVLRADTGDGSLAGTAL